VLLSLRAPLLVAIVPEILSLHALMIVPIATEISYEFSFFRVRVSCRLLSYRLQITLMCFYRFVNVLKFVFVCRLYFHIFDEIIVSEIRYLFYTVL